jgi:hypothetical protein
MSLISFDKARIDALSVHWIGNRSLGEPIILSPNPQQLADSKVHDKLVYFFLNNFRDRVIYSFKDEPGGDRNSLYDISGEIFQNPTTLHPKSAEIARRLYDVSIHHWIKNGECWAVFFSNIQYQDNLVNAIGIFKTELKEEFLSVKRTGDGFLISLHEGFNIKKIDKGALIFNTQEEQGYEIMVIDNINIGDPAEYWKDKFLQAKPVSNPYLNTTTELKILKAFLEDHIPSEESLDRVERLNNSVNYMKENDQFRLGEFGSKVFPEKDMRGSFNEYRNQYKDNFDVDIKDEYNIEQDVIRNPKKFIRSVIKLDKDFHIYIHGNRKNIVKGYDEERGMHFYQIYFSNEA